MYDSVFDWSFTVLGFVYPLLPLFLFAIGLIIFKSRGYQISDIKNNNYEYKRISYKRDKSIVISIIVVIAPLLFICLLFVYSAHVELITNMVGHVDTLCIISMTFTAMIFAMAFVLILRERNYYLVFSLSDVLEKYNFYFWMKALFISCVLVSLLVVSLLGGIFSSAFDVIRFILLQEIFIFNILCMIIAFWIIEQIMFSSEGKELKLLRQLYQYYMIPNVDATHMKENWHDDNAIRMNFMYLQKMYQKYSKKIKVGKMCKIVYLSRIDNGENQKKALVKARERYLFFILLFLFAWIGIYYSSYLMVQINKEGIAQIMFFIADVAIAYIPSKYVEELLIKTYGYNAGYKLYDKKGKDRFIVEETWMPWERKYTNYIRVMNSWIAFVDIAIDKKSSLNCINDELKKCVNGMEKESSTLVRLLPIWIMGYRLFGLRDDEDDMKSDTNKLKYLKETIRQINKDQKKDVRDMIESQISYMERKRKTKNNNKITEYVEWLWQK